LQETAEPSRLIVFHLTALESPARVRGFRLQAENPHEGRRFPLQSKASKLHGLCVAMMLPRAALLVSAALLLGASPVSAEPFGWPQPGGRGSPVHITYSFTNLLDGGFNTNLSTAELREATVSALSIWSRYAPLHFSEVKDSGPKVAETPYTRGAHPDIRIGYFPELHEESVAHAHLPSEDRGGLEGDIHFGNDVSSFGAKMWGAASAGPWFLDFFSAILHESGHAIGLPHSADGSGVMGSVFLVFSSMEDADLLPSDIAAIRALYGAGVGSVTPLDGPVVTPEPSSMLLFATGLAYLLRRKSATRPNVRTIP
jgi:hypothetical protein